MLRGRAAAARRVPNKPGNGGYRGAMSRAEQELKQIHEQNMVNQYYVTGKNIQIQVRTVRVTSSCMEVLRELPSFACYPVLTSYIKNIGYINLVI